MRVLCVGNRYPPWSLGGYEVVWASAVEMLRNQGHPTRVLTTVPDPSDRPSAGPGPADTYRELRWYWRDHQFPALSAGQVVALERHNAAVLHRHLLELRPDAVLWWAMGGMSLSLIEQVRRAGVCSAGLVGDEWMVYGPQVDLWTRRWRRWPSAASGLGARMVGGPPPPDLDRAGSWLFNSQYLLQEARATGLTLPAAAILPPGVDLAHFSARPPAPWSWRLLYCGRLDPRKGVATAIEALALLPEAATLTVHGEGSAGYTRELEELAREAGVAARVSFTSSAHSAVPDVYAAADVLIFPVTWREPWGLVPLEAMAIGRPVVATRSGGGPAEYLTDETNCLQFQPDDPPGLAFAVRRLAEDANLRERLILAGHQTASRYSEAAFHAGILEAIGTTIMSPVPHSSPWRPAG